MSKHIMGMLTLSFTSIAVNAAAPVIERIEPSHWWTGMQSEHLQLMVHGKDIEDSTPELTYPNVSIESVTRVSNHNYLFVDVRIRPNATPGCCYASAGGTIIEMTSPAVKPSHSLNA